MTETTNFAIQKGYSAKILDIRIELSDYIISRTFLPARRSKRDNSYGNVSGWVTGWLAVTLRYHTLAR